MMDTAKAFEWVEKRSWKDISSLVKNIKPKLASIIDDLSPSDDYYFYIAL